MTRSPRLALLLLPLVVAACGTSVRSAALVAVPAAAPAKAPAAQAAPAAAPATPPEGGAVAIAAAPAGFRASTASETALPAPTDPYFYWEWSKNVYSWLGTYEATATLSYRVPNDARITGVNVYFGTEKVASEKNPPLGGVATIPAPRGDVKYYVAMTDAAGRESAKLGPLERPKQPKRYGAPTVTARGKNALTIAWTTDRAGIGYLRYSKDPKWGGWYETPVETRANGFHTATLTGLSPMTRYTLVAFDRRNGEDVEVGRATRWTKLFSIFGSEPGAPETEAEMNAG